jgi:hypothetical protein
MTVFACPDCGEDLPLYARKCACGWKPKEDAQRPAVALLIDGKAVDLQCCYSDPYGRCSKRGSMSHTTQGYGPWWCRDHFKIIS